MSAVTILVVVLCAGGTLALMLAIAAALKSKPTAKRVSSAVAPSPAPAAGLSDALRLMDADFAREREEQRHREASKRVYEFAYKNTIADVGLAPPVAPAPKA